MGITCYLCDSPLVGNAVAEEHVIPNGLGGRLKSRSLLCKDCNNECGKTIDAELVDQLRPVLNALNVARQRGDTPAVEVTLTTGERMIREADGNMRPVPTRPEIVPLNDKESSYSITAASMREARRHVQGLKRKYPKFDADTAMASAMSQRTDYRGTVTFELTELGGPGMLCAVVKIAINYYLHAGGDVEHVRAAAAVVRIKDDPGPEIVGFFYGAEPLRHRDPDAVTHIVAIKSCAQRLSVYVELLSAFRFAVNLSSDYKGPPFNAAYAYDPCAVREITVSASDLEGAPWEPETGLDPDVLLAQLEALRPIAERRGGGSS